MCVSFVFFFALLTFVVVFADFPTRQTHMYVPEKKFSALLLTFALSEVNKNKSFSHSLYKKFMIESLEVVQNSFTRILFIMDIWPQLL